MKHTLQRADRLEKHAARVWDEYWAREVQTHSPSHGKKGFVRRLIDLAVRWGDASRLVREVMDREVGSLQGKRVLEAGCGRGTLSVHLADKGAFVVGMDLSAHAVGMAKNVFRSRGLEAAIVRGNIFSLPFASGEFDVTWNVGVLDQFESASRVLALREMLRVTRSGGLLISMNAAHQSWIHTKAQSFAQRRGRWEFGNKAALKTLKEEILEAEAGTIEKEYSRGLILQLRSIQYFLPKWRWIRSAFNIIVLLLNAALWPLNHFPGQLLITVCKKSEPAEIPSGNTAKESRLR